ncbi:hypothetical protein M0R45_016389 [Rubus argutus]|uniref:Uncharacterized protein n=1 Tax=Rubus argutus TaxID=59490 RepID=A0AAW1XUE3_RUBAR
MASASASELVEAAAAAGCSGFGFFTVGDDEKVGEVVLPWWVIWVIGIVVNGCKERNGGCRIELGLVVKWMGARAVQFVVMAEA